MRFLLAGSGAVDGFFSTVCVFDDVDVDAGIDGRCIRCFRMECRRMFENHNNLIIHDLNIHLQPGLKTNQNMIEMKQNQTSLINKHNVSSTSEVLFLSVDQLFYLFILNRDLSMVYHLSVLKPFFICRNMAAHFITEGGTTKRKRDPDEPDPFASLGGAIPGTQITYMS